MKLYNIEINIQSIRLLGMQLLLYDSKCSGMVVFLCIADILIIAVSKVGIMLYMMSGSTASMYFSIGLI